MLFLDERDSAGVSLVCPLLPRRRAICTNRRWDHAGHGPTLKLQNRAAIDCQTQNELLDAFMLVVKADVIHRRLRWRKAGRTALYCEILSWGRQKRGAKQSEWFLVLRGRTISAGLAHC